MTAMDVPFGPPSEPEPAPEPAPSMLDAPLPSCESHSSISTYRGCPLRYAFRYVERRPGEVSPGQFAFGNAVHAAFEAFVRARIATRSEGAPEPGPEVLREAFDGKVGSCGLDPAEVERACRQAEPALERFLERERASDSEPVAVELGFGVPLPLPGDEGVRFVGYVDRVDRAPDGSTVIVDYKTGRERSQAEVDVDSQLTAYAYGCARGALRDPATGSPLAPASRLGLYFAETGTLVATTRSADELAAFEAGLLETIGHIRDRSFEARPAPWRCRRCEYRRDCPAAAAEA